MGAGRKGYYRPEYHVEEVRKLAEAGLTDLEIYRTFGIVADTFYKWINAHPEFAEALKEGKKKPNRVVEAAAFKRAIGMKVREITYKPATKEGDPAVPIKVVETEVPPNPRSIEFWLTNRMRHKWSRRLDLSIGGHGFGRAEERDPDKIKSILANLSTVAPEVVEALGGNGKDGGKN